MKKSILLIFLLSISQFLFSNPNYKNENGTIITSSDENGVKTTLRKCIINNINSIYLFFISSLFRKKTYVPNYKPGAAKCLLQII